MSTVTSATSTKTYTVTISVAGPQRKSDGKMSWGGHMWYSFSNSAGEDKSYGFATANEGARALLPGPGKPTKNDDALYPKKYSRTINITKAQYDAMKKFGENPAGGGL